MALALSASGVQAQRPYFGDAMKQVLGFCDKQFDSLHKSMLGIEDLKSRVMDLTRSMSGDVYKDDPKIKADKFVEEYRGILKQWEVAKIIQERLTQVILFCTRASLSNQALEVMRDLGLPDNTILQKEEALKFGLKELQDKLKHLDASILQGFKDRTPGLANELENALIAADKAGVAGKVIGYIPPILGGGTRLSAQLQKEPAVKSLEELRQEFQIKGLDTPYYRPGISSFGQPNDAIAFLAKQSVGASQKQNGNGNSLAASSAAAVDPLSAKKQ